MNQNILEYMAAYYNMQDIELNDNPNARFKCVVLSNDIEFVNKVAETHEWNKVHEDCFATLWEDGRCQWEWRPRGWGETMAMGQRFFKIIVDKEIDKESFCNFFSVANLNWCHSMEVLP